MAHLYPPRVRARVDLQVSQKICPKVFASADGRAASPSTDPGRGEGELEAIMLNYSECPHRPILRPALSVMSDYLSGENDPPRRGNIGGSMEFQGGAKTMSPDGKLTREHFWGLRQRSATKCFITPSFRILLLSLHPDYIMTHMLWPRAVDHTSVICEWHFHPNEMGKAEFKAEDAVEFGTRPTARTGHRRASEAAIKSRAYKPGPYSQCESLPHASTRWCWSGKRRTGEIGLVKEGLAVSVRTRMLE